MWLSRFAVVQTRDVYWAAQMSAMLEEGPAPTATPTTPAGYYRQYFTNMFVWGGSEPLSFVRFMFSRMGFSISSLFSLTPICTNLRIHVTSTAYAHTCVLVSIT